MWECFIKIFAKHFELSKLLQTKVTKMAFGVFLLKNKLFIFHTTIKTVKNETLLNVFCVCLFV